MNYEDAIERACKLAHEDADEQARHGAYGNSYLKSLATAKFFEVAEDADFDLDDHSRGSISVDILQGVSAIQKAARN